MTQGNGTKVTDLYLLGFGVQRDIQCVLFTVFLVIYMISMVGDTGKILLLITDSRLQTPMYFFLQRLAFVDICYTSAITPKMLQSSMVQDKSMTFKGCVVQLFVCAVFATSDCCLLTVMAVNGYVANCKPLCYPIIMSRQVCIQLVAISYLMGSINSSVHTGKKPEFPLRILFQIDSRFLSFSFNPRVWSQARKTNFKRFDIFCHIICLGLLRFGKT